MMKSTVATTLLFLASPALAGVTYVDVNADGSNDAVITQQIGNRYVVSIRHQLGVVTEGDKTKPLYGAEHIITSLEYTPTHAFGTFIDDFDADGDLDILVIKAQKDIRHRSTTMNAGLRRAIPDTKLLFLNDGSGNFAPSPPRQRVQHADYNVRHTYRGKHS